VISRTALPGLPIYDVDKTYLLNLIKRLKLLYCVDVLGFCLMGKHFHLVVRMHPEDEVSDEEVIKRYKRILRRGKLPWPRSRWMRCEGACADWLRM
jgi:REP element-mobilizing transposase RayT